MTTLTVKYMMIAVTNFKEEDSFYIKSRNSRFAFEFGFNKGG